MKIFFVKLLKLPFCENLVTRKFTSIRYYTVRYCTTFKGTRTQKCVIVKNWPVFQDDITIMVKSYVH